MILLVAIIFGLVAGLARIWYTGRTLYIPHLRWEWLVLIAFLPQWLAFYFDPTSSAIGSTLASAGLVSSQVLLLAFVWINRSVPAFLVLGIGLGLNLIVIIANGGLMPISPETVSQLAPDAPLDSWHVYERLGTTKDIVLPVPATRLWWLSDRFTFPDWIPYRVAFSIGDVFIAAGAFWFFWTIGSPEPNRG